MDDWNRFATGGGRLETSGQGFRLGLESAVADCLSDAQIDDYLLRSRQSHRWRPPLGLRVRARFSHPAAELLGTAGFGFWNHPTDPDLGFVEPPNWLWFGFYSAPSHIALDDRSAGHGWLASAMNAGQAGPISLAIGRAMFANPLLSRLARRLAATRVRASAVPVGVVMTDWHEYRLRWLPDRAEFSVDGRPVASFECPPRGPLGFVAWMDNQWAGFTADDTIQGGLLAVEQPQWLELADLTISGGAD